MRRTFRNSRLFWTAGVLCLLLAGGCAAPHEQLLATDQSQLALRSIQSRVFDTADSKRMMRSVIATLQDLDFLIQDASMDLGTVTGQKFSGVNVIKITVTVKARNEKQMVVRANAQYGLKAVEAPETYQDFFTALEKSIFLTAQKID